MLGRAQLHGVDFSLVLRFKLVYGLVMATFCVFLIVVNQLADGKEHVVTSAEIWYVTIFLASPKAATSCLLSDEKQHAET